ncbi:peptidoglycan/xylan/chitin deacetylase (PgdA/CDA1 family) [Kitasatospora sp. GAS204A]|uniref:polysaccharide deacetylase family protein n=1 Tax=unclassified Kitasatospora TaxID=2633591 RepID=UPI0024764679|nr:polysaccharide deacetylase family protein [Kitasatospora sp. GAS204B]MDH6116043.1 peptidoglycan/xylan/chitin deacetylase (PgdA/CDA1 family) [Kitasatospora sp. GAS204B]
MPVLGTHRTALRRAAAGCAAVLTLALACACGPRGATSQDAAAAHPSTSGTPSANLTLSPSADPSGSAAASASAGAGGAASESVNPSPRASSSASASMSVTPTTAAASPTAPNSATATTTPSSSATPTAPATTAGAPRPAEDAPGSSIVYSTASGGRTVALTFDDGPGPATGQILDLLAQYHAKATFCEIGPQASANPALVERILAGGHRLCDHTVHHPQPMHTLSHDKQVYEIDAAKDMITQAGGAGTQVSWFRAPGGDFSADNRQIAVQDGLRPLGWTVDTRDWSKPGVPAIIANVQKELHPGGIILMHDGGGDRSQTVAALKLLLPWLVQQGYTFDFPAS